MMTRYPDYVFHFNKDSKSHFVGGGGGGGALDFKASRHHLKKWHNYHIFIISQLWLTSHPRSTVVLLDTATPGTGREIYIEDADDGARTRNPSVINRVL